LLFSRTVRAGGKSNKKEIVLLLLITMRTSVNIGVGKVCPSVVPSVILRQGSNQGSGIEQNRRWSLAVKKNRMLATNRLLLLVAGRMFERDTKPDHSAVTLEASATVVVGSGGVCVLSRTKDAVVGLMSGQCCLQSRLETLSTVN